MIAIISGTNRPGSNTLKVARMLEGIYADLQGDPRLLNLANLPLTLFHPAAYADKPLEFSAFQAAVLDALGVLVVTPEYNGGVPGVLKYFIDMLKFPESFQDRPVCFVGLSAGRWGALRPVEQLQHIFGYRNAYLYPHRVFLPAIHEGLSEQGTLLDEGLTQRLRDQAKGFISFVEKLKGIS